jgi:hypothetical protein
MPLLHFLALPHLALPSPIIFMAAFFSRVSAPYIPLAAEISIIVLLSCPPGPFQLPHVLYVTRSYSSQARKNNAV